MNVSKLSNHVNIILFVCFLWCIFFLLFLHLIYLEIFSLVLIAFELMHYLDHKKSGKDGFMAVKLDMSKAYNRVEWEFIERVMRRMGFHEKWVGGC